MKKNSHKQATKKFSKKIRVGLRLFIKKEAQTRVSRIGNGVHYCNNDYPYEYSNINCNDVNDNDNDYP